MTRNVEMLVRAAEALGDLRDEVYFVGGAVVDLFITDPAAPRPRFTQDVDVVVQVTSYGAWVGLGERLRALGFREDRREGAPLCRWLIEDLVIDVMPAIERARVHEPLVPAGKDTVGGAGAPGTRAHPRRDGAALPRDEDRGVRLPRSRRLRGEPRSRGHHRGGRWPAGARGRGEARRRAAPTLPGEHHATVARGSGLPRRRARAPPG